MFVPKKKNLEIRELLDEMFEELGIIQKLLLCDFMIFNSCGQLF